MRVLFVLLVTWTCPLTLANMESNRPVTREELKAVLMVLEHLGMNKLHFLCMEYESVSNLQSLFSKVELPIRVSKHLSFVLEKSYDDNMVLCPGQVAQNIRGKLHRKLQRSFYHPWLILERNSSTSARGNKLCLSIQVHNQLYFFNLDNLSITERYAINGILVSNSIGQVVWKPNEASFSYVRKNHDSFLERRSNFRGLSLKAMTENDGLNIKLNPSIKEEKAGWMRDKQGHPMKQLETSEATGLYMDLLNTLQNDMNFTTTLYVRKDGAWGHPVNGTWVGMVSNLLNKEADFMLGGLIMNLLRVRVVDYLQRLGTMTGAIHIRHRGLEEQAWLSFLYPLRTEAWILLLLNTLVIFAAVKCFQILQRKKRFLSMPASKMFEETVGDFCMLGASYFGWRANPSKTNESGPLKIIFFVAFLSGTLIFVVYRSSLTAELAVKRNSLPFETLDELYESPYRLTLSGYGKERVRMQATTSSVAAKVYQILSRDEEPLVLATPREAIEDLIATRWHAFLFAKEKMYQYPEYKCDVVTPWTDKVALTVSMVFPKGSPYYHLVNFKLLQRLENGILSTLQEDYFELGVECVPEGEVSLGLLKAISLFGVVMIGIAGASLLLLLECIWSACSSRALNAPSAQEDQALKVTSVDQACYLRELEALMSRWRIDDRERFAADVDLLCETKKQRGLK